MRGFESRVGRWRRSLLFFPIVALLLTETSCHHCEDCPPPVPCSHSLDFVSSLTHDREILDVAVVDRILLLADGTNSVTAVGGPDSAVTIPILPTSQHLAVLDPASGLVSGSYVVPEGEAGAGETQFLGQVIGLLDPAEPRVDGQIQFSGPVVDLSARGTTALAALGSNGAQLLSGEVPSSLEIHSTLTPPGSVVCVLVEGSTAFLGTTLPDAIRAYDITNPSAPSEIDQLDLPKPPRDLAFVEGRLLVASELVGVTYFDFTEAEGFVGEGLETLDSRTVDQMAVADGYLYVPLGSRGLQVFDATRLRPTGAIDEESFGTARLVACGEDELYLVNGIRLIEVAERVCVERR